MEREEVIRELKHLLSLNELAPRTENNSLLNVNLDKRKEALSSAIDLCQAHWVGKMKGIRDVLIKVYGCKVGKEDCLFNKCHNWGICENLEEALTNHLTKK